MTLRVVAGSAGDASTATPILDISEDMEGLLADVAGGGPGSAGAIQCTSRGLDQFSATTPTRRLFTNTITTLPTLAYDALMGRTLVRFTSAAGVVGRTCAYNVDGGVRIPAQVLYGAATAIPTAFLRPLRRYTLTMPARVTALAGGNAFLGISDGNPSVSGNMPASSCAGWVADSTINAGRWTARHRQVTLGAITTDLDSGVATLSTWHELGLRYTEGVVPTLEWLLDTVPVFTLTGDANMLTLTSFINGFYPDQRVLVGAGTVMDCGPARYQVEEV